ncbi:MAG: hypothetical protein ACMUJM_16410 [bacterium]
MRRNIPADRRSLFRSSLRKSRHRRIHETNAKNPLASMALDGNINFLERIKGIPVEISIAINRRHLEITTRLIWK